MSTHDGSRKYILGSLPVQVRRSESTVHRTVLHVHPVLQASQLPPLPLQSDGQRTAGVVNKQTNDGQARNEEGKEHS